LLLELIKGRPLTDSILKKGWGLDDHLGKALNEFKRVRDIIGENKKLS
ncbi:hypothetical protein CFSAN001627_04712, partial [Clostridium botulinum CFSAN001627]